MKVSILLNFTIILVLFISTSIAFAADPIPITAEQAFDAVQTQTDPVSGELRNVALVDIRSRAEYFWVGVPAQVDEIVMKNGKVVVPDLGKVKLVHEGKFLECKVDERYKRIQVKKVESLRTSPIAINIPYRLWNEEEAKLVQNDNFTSDIEHLATQGVEVVIAYCRSGGRSSGCTGTFDTTLFTAVYEIDQPDGTDGRGGFEGSSYGNIYNGYRGFPERMTKIQEHPSVSWKDVGLPIKTSVSPLSQ